MMYHTYLLGALQATRTRSFASVWRRHFPPLLAEHHRGRIDLRRRCTSLTEPVSFFPKLLWLVVFTLL